ncbi:DsrE family protein [Anaerocolumna sp. MB42-C2]|uniref:DsrE family protein n=1 Tax=Anaerocolumna sp. MB42-C2 TaxID=3070997 RepID=UPI0027E1B752|nr:DsrE family protein [Anaerocolumna sp. MB42-C2]WMJ88339.1 DsrE family protein [Anaerocolumna sp. MB42-C2]
MKQANTLNILWTNDNIITSEKMVLMYALNSKLNNWWNEVIVIIWGATAKLVSENTMIQEKIKIALHAGVKFTACKACAEQLNVTEKLTELGIEVKYWGEGLTEILKEDEKLITI